MAKATPKKQTKSSFLSKLVPRTPKSKLIVFLVVFALIGGGVMAYRSFAASNGSFYVDQLGYSGGVYKITESIGIKRSTRVWSMSPGGSVGILPANRPIIWAPYVSGCAFLRAGPSGYNSKSVTVSVTDGESSVQNDFFLSASNEYGTYCTANLKHYNPNARVNVSVKFHGDNSGYVNVGRLDVMYGN